MAAPLAYALTTKEDVKETLGIASSDTSWDNIIIRNINRATEIIEGWCNRRFKETTYTDQLYDASGERQLSLRQFPITDTTPFVLKSRDTTMNENSFDTIDADLFFLDRQAGIVDAVATFWGRVDQWSVTYSAGYATIPSDLAEACAALAAYLTVNDPSLTVGISRKKEGAREVQYGGGMRFTGSSNTREALFAELGILPTLDRYAYHAVSGLG